jgi:hypothetical protein
MVNGLFRDGRLTEAQATFRRVNNAWYHANLTDPCTVDPRVYDQELHPGAAAWFRSSAAHVIQPVAGYLAILDAHGIGWERANPRIPAGSSTRTRIRSSSSRTPRTGGPLSEPAGAWDYSGMSFRRPPAALVCGVLALSTGAQVVGGFGADPAAWQVACGVVAALAAGLAAWWSLPDIKKRSPRIVQQSLVTTCAVGVAC